MLIFYTIIGILSGFLSSTPLGPINLWVANHQLSGSPRLQRWVFLAGVILVDVSFATLALWGQFEFLKSSTEVRLAGLFSSSFTVVVGLVVLYKAQVSMNLVWARPIINLSAFFQGIVLTVSNPAFLLFWLFIANQIFSRFGATVSTLEIVFFGFGVLLGDASWFRLLGLMVRNLRDRSKQTTLRWIRTAVAFAFIGLGLSGVYSYV